MWRVLIGAVVIGVATAHADRASLDALLARTDDVAKEVAKIRGLPLKKPIPNEVVDRPELRRRLLEIADDQKTAAQVASEGLALARWDLIPLDTNYTQLLIDLLTEQIAGYYDPKTKKLTISSSAGDDPAWAEMVLAHEIDHGLQDQKFDLEKFEDLPETEGDAAIARHALVEGDGIVLMLEMMMSRAGRPAPWGNARLTAELTQAMALPNDTDLDQAPLVLRESMMFPYRAGFAFVAALRRRATWSAVDAAYKRPPRSSEQVLHPDKYLADERPIAISIATPVSLPGYQMQHSTVWGELGFELFLRSHGIAEGVAKQAAAGWGGDRAVVFAKDGDRRPARAIGIARLDWDTELDVIEAYEAAIRAFDDSIAGATLEHTPARTSWLALDGTVSAIERHGNSIIIVRGCPSTLADGVLAEAWAVTQITKPAK